MLKIAPEDIESRLVKDNPWWSARERFRSQYHDSTRRDYFTPFYQIATDVRVKRAAILLGPRRVGKTVMLQQMVDQLIADGVDPINILYVSVDAPVYAGIPLENYLSSLIARNDKTSKANLFVMFDEIQYLKDWEVHLKDLVDRYPNVKFIASGSAAAALQLKSRESGAGRFSDFMLPPLTFYEFIKFLGRDKGLCDEDVNGTVICRDIPTLNSLFVEYLNYGGFPEVALNPHIRNNTDQFIKNDIIDKVLLKDLPNLYGIQNIQELNKLFSFLAYNTGQEASLEAISKNSGLSKPAISNYIQYLKSAFLISTLSKLPTSGKEILRQRNFKVYLVNPSMRAALFGEIDEKDSSVVGKLAEAAILSQWKHLTSAEIHYYFRDKHGNEVDLASIKPGTFDPTRAVEIKWSDAVARNNLSPIRGAIHFARKYNLKKITVTSKTKSARFQVDDIRVIQVPTSWYCLNVGSLASRAAIDINWGSIAAA